MNTNRSNELRKALDAASRLSDAERIALRKCEAVVDAGLQEFIKVGVALHQIKKARLYREANYTFESYVAERWDMSRAQAYALIAVAEVVDNIQKGGGDTSALTVSKAKLLATLPFEEQAAVAKEISNSTVKQAKRIIAAKKQPVAKAEVVKHNPGPIPAATPVVILADPPWQLKLGVDAPVRTKTAAYDTMSVQQIKDLGQQIPATDNAHLYLWVTNHTLKIGFEVLEAWGFSYVTTLTWVKPLGTGQGFRGSTEHVLVGRRGDLPFSGTTLGTWFEAEVGGKQSGLAFEGKPAERKHSAKPDRLYEMIEEASPDGNRLELFARRQRKGWVGWGDQLFNDIPEGESVDETDLSQGA